MARLRRRYYQEQRRLLEAATRDRNPERFYNDMVKDLADGVVNHRDLSIRMLFEEFVADGAELVRTFDPRDQRDLLLEAPGVVSTAAFANITGQIVYSAVMEAWNQPEFIGDNLCTTIPTSFNGEKIPGVTGLGDNAEEVGESEEFPMVGVSEEWVDTPATKKRGFIVPVTKEAIFFDRTGLVVTRASDTARWLRINKEKRILDAVFGLIDLYKRNGSAAVATYGDNSGSHDWDNLVASNALVDWTDVENVELAFDGMTDPATGEPITVGGLTIIVPSALKRQAQFILSQIETRKGDGATNGYVQVGKIDMSGYAVESSSYVKSRTSSDTTWFAGNPKKAFAYMENWPIRVEQAPSNSEMEFTRDIVSRFKVSERGAMAVLEPRYMIKCTA